MGRIELPPLEDILLGIENLSNGTLHKKDDLEKLISTSIESDKIEELEKLAFNAKYLNGLTKILQKSEINVNDEYFIKLKGEFQEAFEIVTKDLRSIISNSSSFIQQIIEEKYLKLSQSSAGNLSHLCSDLSYLKMYINDLKSKKGSN